MQRAEYINNFAFWPLYFQGSWSTGDLGYPGENKASPGTGAYVEKPGLLQIQSNAMAMSLEDALSWGTSPLMDQLAELAYNNYGNRTVSSGYCLRAVREALTGMGLTSEATLGLHAKDSVEYFRTHEGFVEITGFGSDEIPLLPRGTIVIYTHPSNAQWSHAQIMLGYDSAVSDYLHDARVYNRNQTGDVWAFIPVGEME